MSLDPEGFLNVIKPPGMTSHDVVGYIRRILSMKRIGHTGTLDPNASGVLPLCLGRATRLSAQATEQSKGYRAEMTLGWTTDTEDAWGMPLDVLSADHVRLELDQEMVVNTMGSFVGTITQTPPMMSAVKVHGRKLYEWAREGKLVERPLRQVTIHRLELVTMDHDQRGYPRVLFDVTCSKGTYIRTLCADIGRALKVGGHMSYLLRTFSGPFSLADAVTLEEIVAAQNLNNLNSLLKPLDFVLQGLTPCHLDPEQTKRFLSGREIVVPEMKVDEGETLCVYGWNTVFIGLGEIQNGQIVPRKVFHEE